jgi:D-xylose transport system substrate-binding protein
MRLKSTAIVGMVAAGALLLAACGSSSSSSGTTTSAAASGSAAASSAASGSAAGGGAATVNGKIGVILPDTTTSTRWENQDRPALEKAFKAAGVQYDIQNANGDKAAMATIADQMVANGATVLAIVALDSESGAAIQKKAAAQGVQTIDYDRLVLGGSSEYYVSFDNVEVGKLQGEGLVKCLGDGQKNVVFLNGAPTDNNAALFKQGAHSVIDANSNIKIVGEQDTPEWKAATGQTLYEQMFTAATQGGGTVDGVLAANDGLAGAVITVNQKNGLVIPVTGQDATKEGLQAVLKGDQCMTVLKATSKEANAVADVAIALVKGETPQTNGTVQDTTGNREVKAILETPEAIFKDNVKDAIDAGSATAAEVCTGEYAALCTAAGIS